MARPRLLALDWGTSTLRACLLADDAVLIEERQRPWGILQLPEPAPAGFAAALRGVAGDWLAAMPGLPVVASGMVGSAQGWREAPYVAVPADATALAAGLLRFEAWPGVDLHIVPGVRIGGDRPDVMRGEETQLVGVLARQPALAAQASLVMPGTHCKWVQVDGGRIVAFDTYMTGELFALLAQHSILGRPAREAGGTTASDAAFERGVTAVRGHGTLGATPLLFSARALVLSGRLAAADSLEYLSGLLVGEELRCALGAQGGAAAAPRVLVGEAPLCARYQRALALFGVPSSQAQGGAASAGLWQVAWQAGLLRDA
jgi:2-dehydro-3-deoxygalactonokinase